MFRPSKVKLIGDLAHVVTADGDGAVAQALQIHNVQARQFPDRLRRPLRHRPDGWVALPALAPPANTDPTRA